MTYEPTTSASTTILDMDTAWMVVACQQSHAHEDASTEKTAQQHEENHA